MTNTELNIKIGDPIKQLIVRKIRNSVLNKLPYDDIGALGLVEEALIDTKLFVEPNEEINGWEGYFNAYISDSEGNNYAYINGTMYYGELKITYETN